MWSNWQTNPASSSLSSRLMCTRVIVGLDTVHLLLYCNGVTVQRCGIYNLAYDIQPADDAIIYVNNDSPVLTSVKICRLTSFHQTLKPRIVSRIRCTMLAFGIRLIRVILSSAPPHFPFTGQPGLQGVDWKWRTWKWRTIKIAAHEIAGHVFAGHKNAMHEIAGHKNARHEIGGQTTEK